MAGGKVTTSSTLTLRPSLPRVHPSLVSILTTLFFLEIPAPRGDKEGGREGKWRRGRETRLIFHRLQPGASEPQLGAVCVTELRGPFCADSTFPQGHEVVQEMCYPLGTHERSMLHRGYAEESSRFRCQTKIFSQGVMPG